jgi:hypothetical protein
VLPVYKQKNPNTEGADSNSPLPLNNSTTTGQVMNTICPTGYDPLELIPLLESWGWLVLGYPETLFNSLNLKEKLQGLSTEEGKRKEGVPYKVAGRLMGTFKLKLIAEDIVEEDEGKLRELHFDGRVTKFPSPLTPDENNGNLPAITYVMCVFRKL